MFEAAELGHRVSDTAYKREEPALREALLKAQYQLLDNAGFPVIVLIGGVDGAGKGETVNMLNAWMDPRHIYTRAFGEMTDEERARPRMWRYWKALPPKGKLGILFGGWHTDPIVDRVAGRISKDRFELATKEIVRFERMLVDEGALLLKFWFHLSKSAQKKRLKALEDDPRTRWRVTETDWKRFKQYDKYCAVSEVALRETSTAAAPWTVIEGVDANYRYLTTGRVLLEALQKRLAGERPAVKMPAALPTPALDGRTVLSQVKYNKTLTHKTYENQLEKYQGELNLLLRHKKFKRRSLVVVFEGMDAAGKGGSIRRVTGALDARYYRVVPIAAPSAHELAQPYLWRFWRQAPAHGRVAIFDRSWYGRVLVERVENLAKREDWMRAYQEINDFEEQLVEAGAMVVKFWLTITREVQLQRFRERERIAFKNYKITPDDWRNRKKWKAYESAVCDMVERTDHADAPWVLIPANDKYWTRIAVLKTLCQRVAATLKIDTEIN